MVVPSPNLDKFCPFTGGGDIYLVNDNALNHACLQLSGGDDDQEEEAGNISPRKEGELRSTSAIENKYSSGQSMELVMCQLQANMLVCATEQLTKLARGGRRIADIKSMTTYGLTFGASVANPLVLVKMTLDFEKNDLQYVLNCAWKSGQGSLRLL